MWGVDAYNSDSRVRVTECDSYIFAADIEAHKLGEGVADLGSGEFFAHFEMGEIRHISLILNQEKKVVRDVDEGVSDSGPPGRRRLLERVQGPPATWQDRIRVEKGIKRLT